MDLLRVFFSYHWKVFLIKGDIHLNYFLTAAIAAPFDNLDGSIVSDHYEFVVVNYLDFVHFEAVFEFVFETGVNYLKGEVVECVKSDLCLSGNCYYIAVLYFGGNRTNFQLTDYNAINCCLGLEFTYMFLTIVCP